MTGDPLFWKSMLYGPGGMPDYGRRLLVKPVPVFAGTEDWERFGDFLAKLPPPVIVELLEQAGRGDLAAQLRAEVAAAATPRPTARERLVALKALVPWGDMVGRFRRRLDRRFQGGRAKRNRR